MRPLSKEQIEYAALDASILIQVYEKIHSESDAESENNCDNFKGTIDDTQLKSLRTTMEKGKSLLSIPLDSRHVKTFIEKCNDDSNPILNSSISTVETPHMETRTAEEAAAAFDIPVSSVGKSIALMCGEELYVVVLSGDSRIDYDKVAEVLCLKRKQVAMVKPEKCVELSGFESGSLPPVR